MRLPWAALLVSCGCTAANHRPIDVPPRDAIRPAAGPFEVRAASPTAEPSDVWLAPDRDVLLQGQVPLTNVMGEELGPGVYHETAESTVLQPDGKPTPRACDASRKPGSSKGFAVLNFECKPMSEPGVYNVRFNPSDHGLKGDAATMPVRVLSTPPPTLPVPTNWMAIPLAQGMPPYPCYGFGESYAVRTDGGALSIRALGRQRPEPAKLPVDLAQRLSPAHAAVVRYVFETDDGWIVLFDHGEFGGGAEWFARAGGEPRTILVGPSYDFGEYNPQNVNRALAVGGELYVLQGLSDMSRSDGQFAKVWREHGHFTSHVIARYYSEPFDWIQEPDGAWLIATWYAIWRTTDDGKVSLVARLPEVVYAPNSFARTPDGTLYIGGRGGVVRLTPTWPEEPRYVADFLVPREREKDCRPGADE